MTSLHIARVRLGIATTAAALLAWARAGVHAQTETALLATTPFPAVEAQPGSTVRLDLSVISAAPEPVDLAVQGLPDGWTATIRGGGFVIHEITATPDLGASADLEIDVPSTAEPGDYPITVVADGAGGRSTVPNPP